MAPSKNDVGKLGKGLKSANLQSVLTRTRCLVAFMDQKYRFVFEQRQDFFKISTDSHTISSHFFILLGVS